MKFVARTIDQVDQEAEKEKGRHGTEHQAPAVGGMEYVANQ